jgi:hypothetical protein
MQTPPNIVTEPSKLAQIWTIYDAMLAVTLVVFHWSWLIQERQVWDGWVMPNVGNEGEKKNQLKLIRCF